MSDGSPLNDVGPKRYEGSSPWRTLKESEKILIKKMLDSVNLFEKFDSFLETCKVSVFANKKVWSLQFNVETEGGYIGQTIAEAEFLDTDGEIVFAALSGELEGILIDLDLWKPSETDIDAIPAAENIIIAKFCDHCG